MRRNLRLLRLAALLVGLVFVLGAREAFAEQGATTATRANSPRDKQILVEMIVPSTMALGVPIELTITVQPLIAAPDVALRWVLPEGVTLLDGPLNENLGTLAAGQVVTLKRQIRIDTTETSKVGVEATFQPDASTHFGDAAVLYMTVDAGGSSVSESDPHRIERLRERIPLGPNASASVAAAGADPNSDLICFTVEAQFTRIDKVWDGTTQQTNIVPITSASIEIWEDDTIFDDLIDVIKTDANGNITYSACDDDGFLGGGLEIYLGITAYGEGETGPVIATLETSPPLWVDLPDLPFSDDGLYHFETDNMDIGSDGTLNFGTVELNNEMSAAINIIETITEAWQFWNDNDNDPGRTEYDEVDVYWSEGGGYGTYYVGVLDNLYLDGEPDPDEWDDSVIIHEWAHFADDKWGCDENPGGFHDGIGLVDSELAWGEGYPDFYQMVVRDHLNQPFPEWYLDLNALGGCSVCFNIETWDVTHPNSLSPNNELAIAAALWDLIDSANDGQDLYTMAEGYPFIESVFIHTFFIDANIGNCDFGSYLQSWQALNGPTDAGAAAAITQNTKIADVFGSAASVATTQNVALAQQAGAGSYGWWERVAYIVDNSKSMEGERLNAIKDVLQGQVDDLFAEVPEGVELKMDTFNNTSSTNQQIFAGKFYPTDVKPAIAALTASAAADGGACPVDAFGALKQTVAGESGMEAWLFTDNYPQATLAPLENFRAELVNRDVSASFAVLQTVGDGSCLSGGPTPQLLLRQKQLQRQLLFAAGPAPSEPSNSIVPYLLTALATGGNFLFVEQGQMDSAADILNAQLKHSAGAGKWSDYVSTQPTYRWDRLASWEYAWIDAATAGTLLPSRPGGLSEEDYEDVPLPAPMLFYSRPVTIAHVYENGYLTFNDSFGEEPNNTQIPNPSVPNTALYPYWDDLEWDQVLLASTDALQADRGDIHTVQQGDWFVIQYSQYASPTSDGFEETFEVLLNTTTGEIRYQYDNIKNGVAGATIGIESWPDFSPLEAIQVSYNEADGAASDTGYRFMPVPPQPTKSYSVTVDSTMQSIGFLLTGFNGTLAPMTIQAPDGVVACNTSGVLCIDVGMVQYRQVNVNGRTGLWKVNVQPGASGSGTFAFSTMAAGPLAVTSPTNHTLPSFGSSIFTINLGQAVDGNQVGGHFLTPANLPFGTTFTLFDDGAHEDGAAGDGIFASPPVETGEEGSAYLWVNGTLEGEPFQRVETRPYSFQPLDLKGPTSAPSLEAKTVVSFTLTNNDTVAHTFAINVQVPDSWRGQLDPVGDGTVSVGPGLSLTFPVAIWMGLTDPDALNQPSGARGTVNVAAVEVEQGILYASVAVEITRNRPPARIEIEESFPFITVNTSGILKIKVYDEQDYAVVDGTVLALSTTLGTLPPTVATVNGYTEAIFAAGNQIGATPVKAQASNGISATRIISITPPMLEQIVLSATVSSLPADGAATTLLVATVLDMDGNPAPNQVVRIGVEGGGDEAGDNPIGTVNGSEVVSGTTNAAGQFQVTFKSGNVAGQAGLRAELLIGGESLETDRIELRLGSELDETLTLPFIRR